MARQTAENIGRGLARGSAIGTSMRQSFAEKLGSALEQRQRDLSYQNFQLLMQRKQLNQAQRQAMLNRQQEERQFNESMRLRQAQLGLAETEAAETARANKARESLMRREQEREKYVSGLKLIQDDIALINTQLRSELSQPAPNPQVVADLQQKLREKYVQAGVYQRSNAPQVGLDYPKDKTIAEQQQDFMQKRRGAKREAARMYGPAAGPEVPRDVEEEIILRSYDKYVSPPRVMQRRRTGATGGWEQPSQMSKAWRKVREEGILKTLFEF